MPINYGRTLGHKLLIIQISGQKTSAQIQQAGHQMDERVLLCQPGVQPLSLEPWLIPSLQQSLCK